MKDGVVPLLSSVVGLLAPNENPLLPFACGPNDVLGAEPAPFNCAGFSDGVWPNEKGLVDAVVVVFCVLKIEDVAGAKPFCCG